MRKYNSIGDAEIRSIIRLYNLGAPLSGYLGGVRSGGRFCEELEEKFADIFGVKHAVAMNSATSCLLAACAAVGIKRGSKVLTTPYTMSATAAAPKFLGAEIIWGDIEEKTFCLGGSSYWPPDAVVITNLFGHPAALRSYRILCAKNNIPLIEDNAQAPFATEDGHYAGTVGDIGVFSFNVHKHLQCGEGGIAVTNDPGLANRLRLFRNHGELGNGAVGLNLRMTEMCAAVALSQLERRKKLIDGRIAQAEKIIHMFKPWPSIRTPIQREGCRHVYYCVALLVEDDRDGLVKELNRNGIPVTGGYVRPLYRLNAFASDGQYCPVTESVEKRIVLFENCAYDPTRDELNQMRVGIERACEVFERRNDNGKGRVLSGEGESGEAARQ